MNRGDLRSLRYHEAVSAQWASTPAWRERVCQRLDAWSKAEDRSLRHWGAVFSGLLAASDRQLWSALLARDEFGQQLRSASPMAVLLPASQRRQILQETGHVAP